MGPNHERVYNALRAMQAEEYTRHGGPESRSIGVNTESLLAKFIELSAGDESEAVREVLGYFIALIHTVSADYGTLIRLKGGETHVGIAIRGRTGPMTEDTSMDELELMAMRRSSVEIGVNNGEKPDNLFLDTYGLELKSPGLPFDDVVNPLIKSLPEADKARLISGLVGVVTQEIGLAGEFPELLQ